MTRVGGNRTHDVLGPLSAYELPRDVQVRVSSVVMANAHDDDDARLLLDVLFGPTGRRERDRAAARAAMREELVAGTRCGTYAGYLAHRRAGTQVCDGCRTAVRGRWREWADGKRHGGPR